MKKSYSQHSVSWTLNTALSLDRKASLIWNVTFSSWHFFKSKNRWNELWQYILFNSVISVYVFAHLLSCVQFFATPWTVVQQAPLSMGFSRQEYWSGLLLWVINTHEWIPPPLYTPGEDHRLLWDPRPSRARGTERGKSGPPDPWQPGSGPKLGSCRIPLWTSSFHVLKTSSQLFSVPFFNTELDDLGSQLLQGHREPEPKWWGESNLKTVQGTDR